MTDGYSARLGGAFLDWLDAKPTARYVWSGPTREELEKRQAAADRLHEKLKAVIDEPRDPQAPA